MRTQIYATSTHASSLEHIKAEIFDWLADEWMEIDGVPADKVIERIAALSPDYTVENVLDRAAYFGIGIVEALEEIEEER